LTARNKTLKCLCKNSNSLWHAYGIWDTCINISHWMPTVLAKLIWFLWLVIFHWFLFQSGVRIQVPRDYKDTRVILGAPTKHVLDNAVEMVILLIVDLFRIQIFVQLFQIVLQCLLLRMLLTCGSIWFKPTLSFVVGKSSIHYNAATVVFVPPLGRENNY
jgi:hypothetical protein